MNMDRADFLSAGLTSVSDVSNISHALWPANHEMPALNVEGIRVTRVIRIHNRYLRNRFEVGQSIILPLICTCNLLTNGVYFFSSKNALEKLVDVSDVSYKRSLEYLFYGQFPSDPSEIFKIVETGFSLSSSYEVCKRSSLFFDFDPFRCIV